MKNSKLMKLLLAGSIALLALTACGQGNGGTAGMEGTANIENNAQAVVADMDVAEFAKQIADKRTDISFVEMTEGYVQGVMSFDTTKVSAYSVYVDASGTGVDEFGVFKANEGSGEEVQSMLQAYLDMRLDTWMEEYMPLEKPKVEKAQIQNKGNYFIYAILSDSEREQVFSQFDSATTK